MMVPGATFNFSSIVRHHAMRQGDREVLVDQGGARRITWSTLDKRVDACAVVLRDAGIGPGDAVGLLLYNSRATGAIRLRPPRRSTRAAGSTHGSVTVQSSLQERIAEV